MLDKALDSYLVAARQAGLSAATLRQYSWHLERLVKWLLGHDVHSVAAVDRDSLRRWGAGLRDGWSPATVRQAVNAARAFFRWLFDEGLHSNDVGQALVVPRVPRRIQRTITADEVVRLLGACDLEKIKGARDAALVLLLIDTGLRASEVCRLQVTNLELEAARLTVVVKGGRQARVRFGRATARRLRGWLEVRPAVAAAGVGSVFVSVGGITPGRALTTRGLRSILRNLGEKVGVSSVSPHAFRRGFAVISHLAGASSRAVQIEGRWSNIREVERYTAALETDFYDRWSPADYVSNGLDV